MTASELVQRALDAFLGDDYNASVELYGQVLAADAGHVDACLGRSAALAKLDRFDDALADADAVLGAQPESHRALLRRGIALHGLERFAEARAALARAVEHVPHDKVVAHWLRNCDEALRSAPASAAAAPAPAASAPAAAAALAKPTVRHEWYQTDQDVFVSVFVKNARKDDVHVEVTPRALSVTVKLPTGADYNLELDLAFAVAPGESSHAVYGTKIEVRMRKAEVGLRWPQLEGDLQAPNPLPVMNSTAAVPAAKPSYPSSAKKAHDWNKLEHEVKQEEAQEKPDGEAALNALFKQIYANGTEEQRRAMIKSYTESGGTTLSTNWSEVAAKPVEIKPPDGMVAKKFEL